MATNPSVLGSYYAGTPSAVRFKMGIQHLIVFMLFRMIRPSATENNAATFFLHAVTDLVLNGLEDLVGESFVVEPDPIKAAVPRFHFIALFSRQQVLS